MKSFFNKSVGLLQRQQTRTPETRRTSYRAAKQIYRHRIGAVQTARSVALIVLGIFSAGFGLKSFLLPNDLIDGGATGISLLLSGTLQIPLPALIILINIPF